MSGYERGDLISRRTCWFSLGRNSMDRRLGADLALALDIDTWATSRNKAVVKGSGPGLARRKCLS